MMNYTGQCRRDSAFYVEWGMNYLLAKQVVIRHTCAIQSIEYVFDILQVRICFECRDYDCGVICDVMSHTALQVFEYW